MIKLFKSKGFSLVELMIVVAIMAILAAVAIPSYLRFQIKARESEMRINLAAIRVCEEAYKAEHDLYLACTGSPAAAPNGSVPVPWADAGGFDTIGFEPDGDVRYQYTVVIGAASSGAGTDSTTYDATALGDVDGDTATVTWTVTESSAIPDNGGSGEH